MEEKQQPQEEQVFVDITVETALLKSIIEEIGALEQYDLPVLKVSPNLLSYKHNTQYPRIQAVKLINRILSACFKQCDFDDIKERLMLAGADDVSRVGDFIIVTAHSVIKKLYFWIDMTETGESADVGSVIAFAKGQSEQMRETILGRIDISYYNKNDFIILLKEYPGITFGNKHSVVLYQLTVDSYNKLKFDNHLPGVVIDGPDDGWFIIKGDEQVLRLPRAL